MGNVLANFMEDVTGQTRRRAEALQRLVEAKEALADQTRRWAEASQRLTEAKEALAATEALKNGSFYAAIDDIMTAAPRNFTAQDFEAIRRTAPHPFYKDIVSSSEIEGGIFPAYESGRSEFDRTTDATSLQSYSGESSTNITRKRRLKEITIDGTAHTTAQIAHLIPYAPSCANAYLTLAEAACGVSFQNYPEATKGRKVLVHGRYQGEKDKKRVQGSGLKHCRTNMARIVGQKENLDINPNVLLLPIMSLKETLAFAGGDFDVLVLCENAGIYVDSLLFGKYELCVPREIQLAIETLECFVRGIAETSLGLSEEVISKIQPDFEREQIRRANKLLQERTVKVPVPTSEIKLREARVMKLKFSNSAASTHQESDPFLLFTKSAIVWSAKNEEKLLPGCTLPPHGCEICAADGSAVCLCETFDPFDAVPSEIIVK